jgi:hypothetical protein
MTRCDATYATDDAGRAGFQTVILAMTAPGDPGSASVPVGACSDDRYRVWHGMDTPAIACGRHATGGIGGGPDLAVFRGHRNRVSS